MNTSSDIKKMRQKLKLVELSQELVEFVNKNKIPYKILAQETCFTEVYISRVMNSHLKPSPKFIKLLAIAIEKISWAFKDELDIDREELMDFKNRWREKFKHLKKTGS